MKYQAVIFDYRETLGFKEIPKFIQQLIPRLYDAGYLLGVISNSDRYGDARWLRHMLVKYNIFEYFQCVVGSAVLESGESQASKGVHKPDPAIFYRVLNLLGVEPHEAVYVGDSFKHDILGAGSIGMGTLHVNHIGDKSYTADLWALLKDVPTVQRPNRVTGFRFVNEHLFECQLRHLTEPLTVGGRIIVGKKEYSITEFEPEHNKDEIIHAHGDTIARISVIPLDNLKELNQFSGIDLDD